MESGIAAERTASTTSGGPARTRPAPTRDPAFAHLSLDRLRADRQELLVEESRTSYWRRLLQARLDVLGLLPAVTPAVAGRLVDPRAAGAVRRPVVLSPEPADAALPLVGGDLDVLWEAVDPADRAARAELARRLARAEQSLSAYRQALHRRLDAVTRELIARYREDPAQCLVALPTRGPTRRRSPRGPAEVGTAGR